MEEDDLEFVASEHDRLVSAITKLDKTQHITEPTRNEPSNLNSEFNLIKRSNKLKLDNVVKVLEDTAKNAKIGRKLQKSQDVSKILKKPLEKPQAERIKRATGYEQAKKKVGRWDPVVSRNRTVDFVTFPLKTFPSKLQPTNDFLSKLKLQSPLEKVLEEVDPRPAFEVEEEEEKTYPMSYEEMLEHRKNLAKMRAQQSYNAAKAKRQSKIKSKKYHRILKKEKLKQQLKEFEELQTKNPEEALKKLEDLEKARALERHTLRHKNTGKWAKSKLVRAKYDKETRQQLAEQLSVSKGLTQKVLNTESTDDSDDENIPDLTLDQDSMNPWMMKRSGKTNVDAEFDFGYKKYLKDKMYKRKEESDTDSDEENEKHQLNDKNYSSLAILTESVKKLGNALGNEIISSESKQINMQEVNIKTNEYGKNEKQIHRKDNESTTKVPKKSFKPGKITATSTWIVESINPSTTSKCNSKSVDVAFDKFEDKVAGKVQKKITLLKKQISKLEKPAGEAKYKKKENNSEETDNLEYLKLKKIIPKPFIDEELIETHKGMKDVDLEVPSKNIALAVNLPTESDKVDIDPSRFIEVKPKYLNTALSNAQNDFDDLDDEEQVVPKVDIAEVFEEDDVVASFRQEKEDEKNKDIPQDIDLTLPGWGSWGGKGVKAPKRKRNRFIVKPAPKVPRRDDNKGDIIINEIKNPKLTIHKVSDVPFPFTSIKDYEASIRTPLGNTFIPETAHKKLIRPSVITKSGAIIEPMDEDELLKKRNRTFNNESVIKLLGKNKI